MKTSMLQAKLVSRFLQLALYAGCSAVVSTAHAASIALSQAPLFLTTGAIPNILITLTNAQNMDEDPSGSAAACVSGLCGSASPLSKSEIARGVAKTLISTYTTKLNMGLMAFQQYTSGGNAVSLAYLHNSPYDASYNPANYNSSFTGSRDSLTKKFRILKPGSSTQYIYYNVAAPFYAGANYGTGYCYSTTADASHNFTNGEYYYDGSNVNWNAGSQDGPWDYYRCFSNYTGTTDTLPTPPGPAPAPHSTSCGSYCNNTVTATENSAGYSGFKGGYYVYPTDSDLAQGISDFGRFNPYFYVGPTWFSNASPGGGYLHVPISFLDSTQAGKMNTKLGTSQFVSNKPTNPSYPLQNAGLTAIEGTLVTTQTYFNTPASLDSENGGPAPALPNSCNKNFNVFITNGLPSVDKNGNPIQPSGVSAALTNASTAAANLLASPAKVETYIVGFAMPYGTNPSQLNTIASAGGTGTAYSATDANSLTTALNKIFSDILSKTGAASSVSLNSGSASGSDKVFQAKFSSVDWSGQLIAYNLDSTGTIISSPIAWDAGQAINGQNYDTGRKILTIKPSSGLGIAFRWPAVPGSPTATELDPAEVLALNTSPSNVVDTNGAARLDYIRGSTANEGTGLNFRPRNTSKLGDIVHSAPYYVGAPAFNYPDDFATGMYSAFSTAYATRPGMIYAGANDGMLHGFDEATGQEKLAYIPASVYANLTQLTSTSYSHRYFVDGSPSVGDAFIKRRTTSGALTAAPEWRSILVSGLAAGGQGFFALDVTDPSTFSEANAASIVRWEFNDLNDSDMGYSFSQPAIVKLNNDEWVAIFGNGYNNTDADGHASSTGYAALYIVDLETGSLVKKFTLPVGSTTTPNGLATPAVIDANGDRVADYVYAGDLLGNMWKFDLTSTNPAQWKIAYGSVGSPKPLFTALDASNNPQPITDAPDVGFDPNNAKNLMVYFGTGKYLEVSDITSTTPGGSFYAIRDAGAVVASRSTLIQQSILGTQVVGTKTYRITSQNPANASTPDGWYMDLTSGERVVTDPVLFDKRIFFTTLIPSTGSCSPGGSGALMELDAATGGRLASSPFDTSGNGTIDIGDNLTYGGNSVAAGGLMTDSIPSGVSIQPLKNTKPQKQMNKLLNQSDGSVNQVLNLGASVANGRVSWHELIQ